MRGGYYRCASVPQVAAPPKPHAQTPQLHIATASSGPTQAGTTPSVVFRARLGTGGERQGAGDASLPGSMMYVKGLVPEDRRRWVPELQTLMSGIDFGESPRWHENRLWFSDWGAQEIIAV